MLTFSDSSFLLGKIVNENIWVLTDHVLRMNQTLSVYICDDGVACGRGEDYGSYNGDGGVDVAWCGNGEDGCVLYIIVTMTRVMLIRIMVEMMMMMMIVIVF